MNKEDGVEVEEGYEIVDADDEDEIEEGSGYQSEEGGFNPEDFDEEYGDKRRGGRKQSKEDRERTEASAFLLANKSKVTEMEDEESEVDDAEMPDLDRVKGPRPRKTGGGATETEEYLDEYAGHMQKYTEDLGVVLGAVQENEVAVGTPPYSFLPPDLKTRLNRMTPNEVGRWADLCRAEIKASNLREDREAGAELVKGGASLAAWGVVRLYKTRWDEDLSGLDERVGRMLARKPEFTARLYTRYVEPLLNRVTGGRGTVASDLMQLGMIFQTAIREQRKENALLNHSIGEAVASSTEQRGKLNLYPNNARPSTTANPVHAEMDRKVREGMAANGIEEPKGAEPKQPLIELGAADAEALRRWQEENAKSFSG